MALSLRRLVVAAGLCILTATLSFAQDWKTAVTLPGVDLSKLSAAQKATALKILLEGDCSCGCKMKLAQCRVLDPSCSYSNGLAGAIVDALQHGKTATEAIAAANASKWAHVQQPKVLDDPVPIPTAGSPVLGPQDARVTIVEFSDFQCPYCAAAVPQINAILKAYPSQVKLIFKQFPLEIHSQADLAAAAAIAAQKQGKFWPLHDAMFANRDDLSRNNLLLLAKQTGMDMNRFGTDIDSTEVRETVVRDVQDGNRAGVEGTPTIFINGQKYNGPITVETLKPILDAQLKQATPVKQTAKVQR
jgi:protein-disulfide isomerase